jgi:hypothetical protein
MIRDMLVASTLEYHPVRVIDKSLVTHKQCGKAVLLGKNYNFCPHCKKVVRGFNTLPKVAKVPKVKVPKEPKVKVPKEAKPKRVRKSKDDGTVPVPAKMDNYHAEIMAVWQSRS